MKYIFDILFINVGLHKIINIAEKWHIDKNCYE